MPLANLRSLLNKNNPHNVALVTSAGNLTYGDLCQSNLDIKDSIDGVIIIADKVSAACKSLVALDGIVPNIYISSSAMDPSVNQRIIDEQQIGAIISDQSNFKSLSRLEIETSKEQYIEEPGFLSNWIMITSGTTGAPKLVSQNLESLTRTAYRGSQKVNTMVWGLLYDYSRFAGMQVVLQGLFSGAKLVAPDFDWPFEQKLEFFVDNGVNSLSATPTMWRKILMYPVSRKLDLKQITLGGEIADQAILDSLIKMYSNAHVTHIFASTEAGVGFSVKDGKAGFPEEFLHKPQKGIALKIHEERLFVKNPLVGQSYLDSGDTLSENGWVDTGDRVKIKDERVYFLGRENGMINVGGNKISPEEVEIALLEIDNIDMARVYAKSNPITGALICADIVLKSEVSDLKSVKRELITRSIEKLGNEKAPAIINIVPSLELNRAGKIERKLK